MRLPGSRVAIRRGDMDQWRVLLASVEILHGKDRQC